MEEISPKIIEFRLYNSRASSKGVYLRGLSPTFMPKRSKDYSLRD